MAETADYQFFRKVWPQCNAAASGLVLNGAAGSSLQMYRALQRSASFLRGLIDAVEIRVTAEKNSITRSRTIQLHAL